MLSANASARERLRMYTLPQQDLESIINDTQSLWPRNKNFFVTGGTGFFGRWLIESISLLENKLNSNNTFYILSRGDAKVNLKKIPALNQSCFKIIQGDLKDFILPPVAFDYVIHAAADVGQAKLGGQLLEVYQTLVSGTQNLLEQLKKQKLTKFLLVSSGAVYGPHSVPVNEQSNCQLSMENLSSAYAEGKRSAEWLTLAYSKTHGLPVNCVRCFAFVGPYADPGMAVMDFLNAKANGKSVVVKAPETVRSYMYPTDLICGLFLILFRADSQKTYNLGSDHQVTLGQLALKITGNKSDAQDNVVDSANGLSGTFYVPNVDKLNRELNFKLKVNLDTALTKTLNWITNEKF